jgi:hypothetical protein
VTTTTFKGAYLPAVSGDAGTWGGLLNTTTFPVFDANLGGIVTKSLSSSNVTLSASESQNAILRLTGTLTGNVQVTTTCQGFTLVQNATSGSYTVTLTNGTGAVATIPQGMSAIVHIDATNGAFVAGSMWQRTITATAGHATVANGDGVAGNPTISIPALVRQAVTASSASLAIDMALGWSVALTLSATVTSFTVSNWPASGVLGKLTLEITSGGAYSISAYPGTTKYWTDGTAPTITPSGRDTVILTSGDGGTVFRNYLVSQSMS